eukprot:NODE_159_length_16647_cov_0.251390.p10 type:complete len:102 gc:universal NODE_159_length_16647_cov_0.251390:6981-6676(-)
MSHMFQPELWRAKTKGFSFKSICKSKKSTLVYMELYPSHDKMPELISGNIIITLVEGQCLLLLDETILELPNEPVIVEDKHYYALKNVFSKKCSLFIDFLQ